MKLAVDAKTTEHQEHSAQPALPLAIALPHTLTLTATLTRCLARALAQVLGDPYVTVVNPNLQQLLIRTHTPGTACFDQKVAGRGT